PDQVDLLRILPGPPAPLAERGDHGAHVGEGVGQLPALGLEPVLGLDRSEEVVDLAAQRGPGDLPVPDDLAEEEVLALDTGGALVEGVDLRVPDVLLDRVVLQEAGSAEDLQGGGQL